MPVTPTARAPNIRARCEIDLSPATVSRPESGCAGGLERSGSGSGLVVHGGRGLTGGWARGNAPHPFTGGLCGTGRRSFYKALSMAKPDLGMKRICVACGAKFYDLAKVPASCPKCGTEQPAEQPRPKPRPGGGG